MVYAAPSPLLLLLLFDDAVLIRLPLLAMLSSLLRALGPDGRLGAVVVVAAVTCGEGGGDGIPVLTSNPPPDPCD